MEKNNETTKIQEVPTTEKYVTEEMRPQDEWFERARNIKSIDDLTKFAEELLVHTHHDYGTVCHAIGAVALGAAWMGSHIQGITGFQAGFVMWDFVRQWMYSQNKTGLKIIDYDNMLYPQYESKFAKTINERIWTDLQKEAFELLKTDTGCWAVRDHWGKICRGEVPFGMTVVDDRDECTSIQPMSYPGFTEDMIHTQTMIENAWRDYSSPFYDKKRANEYFAGEMLKNQAKK